MRSPGFVYFVYPLGIAGFIISANAMVLDRRFDELKQEIKDLRDEFKDLLVELRDMYRIYQDNRPPFPKAGPIWEGVYICHEAHDHWLLQKPEKRIDG